MARASGHTAVMADKVSTKALEAEADPARRLHLALNYFPTPPWATRALLEHVIYDAGGTAWEPAAGEGHMAGVLAERFDDVYRTDVHDYSLGASGADGAPARCGLHAVGSFVGQGLDVLPGPEHRPDWIITNPPFSLAAEFAERALDVAGDGVALLMRTAWLEGQDRYERLFRDSPPTFVAVFVERVPMTLGRWDPDADTATAYAWFVWRRASALPAEIETPPPRWAKGGTTLIWIPPGCRQRLERADDRRRFTTSTVSGPTLFDGADGPAASGLASGKTGHPKRKHEVLA